MASSTEKTYEQSLLYLYEHLPQYSRLGKSALKHKLDNIITLCDHLGNPHLQYKTIHIAGTNGKGSTSHMMAATLMQAGYKVGLYTSPHLVDFRERIRINGTPVSMAWVNDFVARHKSLIETIHPSYFEATVAMAFQAFADERVDVAVIETGLGGRLDSTNIVQPELCIITNITYDHKDVLGDTLTQIAAEKAGIFKPKIPVVIGESTDETEKVFFEKALHTQNTLYYAAHQWEVVGTAHEQNAQQGKAIRLAEKAMYDYSCDLPGQYQKKNIRTVLTAATVLSALGWKVTVHHALEGIAQVKRLTGIRGRWDVVSHKPFVVVDVAHNPAGIQEVMQQWATVKATRKVIITGFVKDKDVQEALQYFPKEQTLWCCQAQIPRALPAHELVLAAEHKGYNAIEGGPVEDTVTKALAALTHDDALLIVGSFFVAGEALPMLEAHFSKHEKPIV